MMKFSYLYCKEHFRSLYFKIAMGLFLVGSLFLVSGRGDISYINFIYYGLSHPYLIIFFMIPITCYFSFTVMKDAREDPNIKLYCQTKKMYFRFLFYNTVIVVSILFLLFLFILVLEANLFASRDNLFTGDPNYPTLPNWVGMLYSTFKLLGFLIGSAGIMNLILCFNKKLQFINVSLFILSIASLLDFIDTDSLITTLLPCRYIGFLYHFSSPLTYVISSLAYTGILLLCSYFLLKWCILKRDEV